MYKYLLTASTFPLASWMRSIKTPSWLDWMCEKEMEREVHWVSAAEITCGRVVLP
jgi:hypothetical protein